MIGKIFKAITVVLAISAAAAAAVYLYKTNDEKLIEVI